MLDAMKRERKPSTNTRQLQCNVCRQIFKPMTPAQEPGNLYQHEKFSVRHKRALAQPGDSAPGYSVLNHLIQTC